MDCDFNIFKKHIKSKAVITKRNVVCYKSFFFVFLCFFVFFYKKYIYEILFFFVTEI